MQLHFEVHFVKDYPTYYTLSLIRAVVKLMQMGYKRLELATMVRTVNSYTTSQILSKLLSLRLIKIVFLKK